MNKKEPILSIKNICKDYVQGRSNIEVLKDISLDLFAGEMIAIVGASGSGKSTMLHIAGLLDTADSGNIKIADFSIEHPSKLDQSHKVRIKHIGFIYQQHHLLHDFKARENVAMPLIISGASLSDAYEQADELLDRVGLGSRLYNLPGELSGGEMQRVAIARSLINKPNIILADEPTGNLDPHTAFAIFELLLEQVEKEKIAIVMATHNMELANKMHQSYNLDYSLHKIK